jgi:hypothetical protein
MVGACAGMDRTETDVAAGWTTSTVVDGSNFFIFLNDGSQISHHHRRTSWQNVMTHGSLPLPLRGTTVVV